MEVLVMLPSQLSLSLLLMMLMNEITLVDFA